ncbi:MAG: iron-sulfur cluster assembly protein [bacterium]|nr:iron-sulfur cluster assembly protein [bacterium]
MGPGLDQPGAHSTGEGSRPIGIREVVEAIDEVPDPCSQSMGRPIGLAEMAILRKVEVSHESISVGLCLTEPTCLYAFQIAESVQDRLRSVFGEDVELRVEFLPEADGMWWTEDYVSPAARVRLAEARRLDRRSLSRIRSNQGPSTEPDGPDGPST